MLERQDRQYLEQDVREAAPEEHSKLLRDSPRVLVELHWPLFDSPEDEAERDGQIDGHADAGRVDEVDGEVDVVVVDLFQYDDRVGEQNGRERGEEEAEDGLEVLLGVR